MTRRDEAFILLDEAVRAYETATARARAHSVGDDGAPNRLVARGFDEAADRYEVAIDALLEVFDHAPAPAIDSMRQARLRAFQWSHESIPGLGEYWSTPRYRITATEACRRLAHAGVKKRRGKYYLHGREIKLPGYHVPTPLGSGLHGRLGLMSDEDGGPPNLWYIEVSRDDIARGVP